jgi:hypothetical protein
VFAELTPGVAPEWGRAGGLPAVMLEEDAMARLEASAWPLACGSACVFALAVVLKRLPWQLAFAAVVLAVLAWAWRSPLIAGVALGAIAWLCVTGFDVHRFGDIRITGSDDAARAAVLVLTGVLTASAHLVIDARRRVRADPVWADFHQTELELTETSGDVMRRLGHRSPPPRRGTAGIERAVPVHPTEEP